MSRMQSEKKIQSFNFPGQPNPAFSIAIFWKHGYFYKDDVYITDADPSWMCLTLIDVFDTYFHMPII